MKIEYVPIESIQPYQKNAKKHPKKQVQQIADSISEFGFNQPIVVDEAGVIIVGHGRYCASQQLGLIEVPILRVAISDEKARAYRLADNKLNESDWDMQLVVEELKGLDIKMLDLTGFDRDLVIDNTANDDRVPETPANPRTKLGDVYHIGNHIVMCGDSTKPEDYKKLMGENFADMIFTDPPYNVDYKGAGKKTSNGIMNDSMTDEAFDSFLVNVFTAMKDVTKRSAGAYVFHSHKTASQFELALVKAGYTIDTQLIWNKPSAGMGMNDYRTKHEPFFYCSLGEKKNFYGDRTNTTVWRIPDDEASRMKWWLKFMQKEETGGTTVWTMKRAPVGEYVHPTQKPVELIQTALHNSSKIDDIVLDPFGDSGSTLIACEKMNRHARIMELDPKYVDVIIQRYVDYTGDGQVEKNGILEIWQANQQENQSDDQHS